MPTGPPRAPRQPWGNADFLRVQTGPGVGPKLRPSGFCNLLCLLSRQLCLLLNAENIFHSMADILLREEDLKFASTMVHTLNTILLTSTELFQLRNQLKDLKTLVLASVGPGLGLGPVCPQAFRCAAPAAPGGSREEAG